MKAIYAVTAILMLGISACGGKKDTSANVEATPAERKPAAVAQEINFERDIEIASATQAVDTISPIIYKYMEATLPSAKVERYFSTDSADIYLSLIASVPDDFPTLSNYVAVKVTDLYNYITDAAIAKSDISDDSQLAALFDAIGHNFKTEIAPQYSDAMMPAFNISINMQPMWANSKVVTYAVFDEYYTGGAHGMTEYYLETVDPATGSPYTFETLIKPDKAAEVRRMLVRTMAESQGLTTDQFLAQVNDFLDNEGDDVFTAANFPIYHIALTGRGIVAIYPPYSIAPYSDGQPSFVIPNDDFIAF